MMVLSGVPVGEAVRHFCDAEEEDDRLAGYAERWPVQDEVVAAVRRLNGDAVWHELTDSTRLDVSLKKHYNEMAYFLWSTNYVELEGSAKVKADTCRAAIEAKVAGMAGKESPLAAFYHNLLQRYEQQGKPVN
tara:strand:- start:804 stop:1202 length:399 start_codon:yes stop_codon:yes gene_type:complete